MTAGDGGEAYTAIAWGVVLSHEGSDIAGTESNMCGTAMRGAIALPGSKGTSRAKDRIGSWEVSGLTGMALPLTGPHRKDEEP